MGPHVGSFFAHSSIKISNLNFAKAGATAVGPEPYRRAEPGPSLGKIKILNLNFLFYEFLSFSSISVDFGGARRLLMSKSDSLMIFAPGTQLLRSI